MLGRSRDKALVILLMGFGGTSLIGWVASIVVVFTVAPPTMDDRARLVAWLAVAQLAVFIVLVVVGWVLIHMGTRFIQRVFRQEDRVMQAVAHEVRNPLSRMLVVAEEGMTAARDPAASLRDVVEEAEALNQYIGDLVESIRVMAGDLPVGRTTVHLDQTVAILPARTRLGEAEIRVEAEPAAITGNPRLLRLGVINLVRNAAQHAYRGGPGLIVVRADRRGVAVIDSGAGMSPDAITEVMTWPGAPIRRLGGLGLPFVSWVAEVHGGRLQLVNRPEGGLEARLELPAHPADAAAS